MYKCIRPILNLLVKAVTKNFSLYDHLHSCIYKILPTKRHKCFTVSKKYIILSIDAPRDFKIIFYFPIQNYSKGISGHKFSEVIGIVSDIYLHGRRLYMYILKASWICSDNFSSHTNNI